MAGPQQDIRYYEKKNKGVSTNWLWVVQHDHSLLIGWDYHLKTKNGKKLRYIEIYSVNRFECQAPFFRRGYDIVVFSEIKEVLEAAQTHIDSLTGQIAA